MAKLRPNFTGQVIAAARLASISVGELKKLTIIREAAHLLQHGPSRGKAAGEIGLILRFALKNTVCCLVKKQLI